MKLTCLDCPAPYGEDGWCDVVVPDYVWNEICPEGGVLCFRCMTKRIEAKGYGGSDGPLVPVIVASGPYRDANEGWRIVGWFHGYKSGWQNKEQEDQGMKRLLELRDSIQAGASVLSDSALLIREDHDAKSEV